LVRILAESSALAGQKIIISTDLLNDFGLA
jgi:hypothetical protein